MSGAPSFTLFTYSPDVEPLEARWRDDGIGAIVKSYDIIEKIGGN